MSEPKFKAGERVKCEMLNRKFYGTVTGWHGTGSFGPIKGRQMYGVKEDLPVPEIRFMFEEEMEKLDAC